MLVVGALVGGTLFGLGALLNGACAFGTVARLGSGEVSFLALIPGFLVGAWSLHWAGMIAAPPAAMRTHIESTVLAPMLIALVAFAVWRVWAAVRFVRAPGNMKRLADGEWPPAFAVALIAIVNVALLLIVFSWPYTSLLGDLAYGRAAWISSAG